MKNLLLVIDFQKDFVDGALGFENACKLDEKIASKIKSYRKNNDDIIFTFDTHEDNYLDTFEGKNLPVKHCIKGSEGWKLYGETGTLIQDSDRAFLKPTFGSYELLEYLKNTNYEKIEIVGLVTNVCVISNAIIVKTAQPETPIVVDASCVSSYDSELHNKTLDVMEGLQISIINR